MAKNVKISQHVLDAALLVHLLSVPLVWRNTNMVGFGISVGNTALVSAATTPGLMVWSMFGVLLYCVLLSQTRELVSLGFPSWQRRAVASVVDGIFSALVLFSIAALVPLALEAIRTHHFAWRFERNYAVATDFGIGVPLVFITMGLIFLYFAYPLTLGKQTVGSYLLRIRVTPPFGDDGRFTFREAMRRTWYEFRGIASMPFRKDRDQDAYGRTWWDRETDCTVTRVEFR
jgi:hypothetical protein